MNFPTPTAKPIIPFPDTLLASVFEDLDVLGGMQHKVIAGPNAVRCWFRNPNDRTIVQVQADRLCFNWAKRDTEDEYPSYEWLRSKFDTIWQAFLAFLRNEGLGPVKIAQAEISYINHMDDTDVIADLLSVMPNVPRGSFLGAAETTGFETTYVMPNQKGRLRISLQQAVRKSDGQGVSQLSLTSRTGIVAESHDLMEWFDLGRTWIVEGFAAITTEAADNKWGRYA